MSLRKRENGADVIAGKLRVLHDSKIFQQCSEARDFRLVQALLALAHQNGVRNFKAPDGWYQDGMASKSNQNIIGIFACFIRKTASVIEASTTMRLNTVDPL